LLRRVMAIQTTALLIPGNPLARFAVQTCLFVMLLRLALASPPTVPPMASKDLASCADPVLICAMLPKHAPETPRIAPTIVTTEAPKSAEPPTAPATWLRPARARRFSVPLIPLPLRRLLAERPLELAILLSLALVTPQTALLMPLYLQERNAEPLQATVIWLRSALAMVQAAPQISTDPPPTSATLQFPLAILTSPVPERALCATQTPTCQTTLPAPLPISANFLPRAPTANA
jgi:hypothetical protein